MHHEHGPLNPGAERFYDVVDQLAPNEVRIPCLATRGSSPHQATRSRWRHTVAMSLRAQACSWWISPLLGLAAARSLSFAVLATRSDSAHRPDLRSSPDRRRPRRPVPVNQVHHNGTETRRNNCSTLFSFVPLCLCGGFSLRFYECPSTGCGV
jgi:hypothetical protein